MENNSNTHEWVRYDTSENRLCTVGITRRAQKELGEIVYIELPVVGKFVAQGEELAVLESTKAATDIYSPVSGTILEVNLKLKETPELINASPEELGWICKIRAKE